jgi:hypothetical protein
LASVVVHGKGYGDDASPRLITIEDCSFVNYRGYAVLVSPGIQMPNMPTAPEFRVEQQQLKQESSSSLSSSSSTTMTSSNLVDIDVGGGGGEDDAATVPSFNVQSSGQLYGSGDGNDGTGGNDDLDEAEMSTVILSSLRESDTTTKTTTTAAAAASRVKSVEPTHIVELSCFLGSKVGMSNVLATSSEAVGFGQRDNHVAGTVFTWASTCEGAAAEETGDDCLETGDCDGTCVEFTRGECLASRVDSGGYE